MSLTPVLEADKKSLNDLLSDAKNRSLKSSRVPDLYLDEGDYYLTYAKIYEMRGIRIRGKGRGTRIHFTATAPAPYFVGSLTAGILGTITTETIGAGFRGLDGQPMEEFMLKNVCLIAYEETLTTAADIQMLSILSNNVTIDNVFVKADESVAVSTTQKSPHKMLDERNVLSCTALYIGQSKWEEPSPEYAIGCTNIKIRNLRSNGEPLGENWTTASSDNNTKGRLNLLWCRKCSDVEVDSVSLAQPYNNTFGLTSDLLFTSQPANSDNLRINQWDPFLKRFAQVTYTWRTNCDVAFSDVPNDADAFTLTDRQRTMTIVFAAAGGDNTTTTFYVNTTTNNTATLCASACAALANTFFGTSAFTGSTTNMRENTGLAIATITVNVGTKLTTTNGPYDVNRASSSATAAGKLVQRINMNFLANGGVDFVTAQGGNELLASPTTAVVRISSTAVAATGSSAKVQPAIGFYNPTIAADDDKDAFLVISTGAYATHRPINKGTRRSGYYRYPVVMEDSPFVEVENVNVSSVFCEIGILLLSTARHNDFIPNEWSEAGHFRVSHVIGDGFTYNTAGIASFGAGFGNITDVNPGQNVLLTGGGGLIWVKEGNHRAYTLTLTNTNVADGDTVTVTGGHGDSEIFEWDNNGSVTPGQVPVTIGADNQASLRNLRLGIQLGFRAHVLAAYCDDPQLSGTDYILTVTFLTWGHTWASSSSVAESGAQTSAADNSQPYRPTEIFIDTHGHWPAGSTGAAAPYIVAERVYEQLHITGSFPHIRPINSVNQSAHELWTLTLSGVPNATDGLHIRGLAAGGYLAFLFSAAADVPGTTYYIGNRGPITNADECLRACMKTINDALGDATWGANGAFGLYANGAATILKGNAEEDSSFITKTDVGTKITITRAAGLGHPAALDTEGMLMPIVINDCTNWLVAASNGTGLSSSTYIGTTFYQGYFNNLTDLGLDPTYNGMFGGLPMKLVYVKKSAAGVPSKGSISGCHLFGPWGAGLTGDTRYYTLGANMADADIKVNACAINGA